MFRKFFVLTLCVLVLLGMVCVVYGEESEQTPQFAPPARMKYAKSTSVTLDRKGESAVISARIIGDAGKTTKLKGNCILQKFSNGKWNYVDNWSESTNARILSMNKKRKVSGGTYRIHAVFRAYAGDKVETITDNSGKVKF